MMIGAGKTTDYLANERTFLAWIRTSLAIISLGFVVAKFSVWLRELAAGINPQTPIRSAGASMPLGIAMISLGSLLAVLALLHYQSVKRAISRGDVGGHDHLVVGVAIAVGLLGMLMIYYILSAAQQL